MIEHLWIYRYGQPATKVFTEDVAHAVLEFPTFIRGTNETRRDADLRWKREYPAHAQAIHKYMELLVCKTYCSAMNHGTLRDRQVYLEHGLQAFAELLIAQRQLGGMHNHVTLRPMTDVIEVNVHYGFNGGSASHSLTVSPLSPTQQVVN